MANPGFQGYLAKPPAGQGPGVLVLHPWWGLNDTMRDVCDRLAHEGFVAVAPDLYHSQIAISIPEAEALSSALDAEQAMDDIALALDVLRDHVASDVHGIAVIGFSLGAYFALELSVADPDRIPAVVLYYGTGRRDFPGAKAAYLGHFAENDDFEPAAEVDHLETVLRAAGRPVTFHRYAGVGHWFVEPDRPDAYNQPAAEQAWERTLAFLYAFAAGALVTPFGS